MTQPTLARRLWQIPLQLIILAFLLVDGLVAPLFRPVMRFLSSLRLIHRLEAMIAALPPYVILVLLAGPFAVAELAKVYAVLLMAEDHVRVGLTIFIGAYIVSILVCERIFSAGRAQLMTIGWFRIFYTWLIALRDRILTICRETAVWRVVARGRARLAARLSLLRAGLSRRQSPALRPGPER